MFSRKHLFRVSILCIAFGLGACSLQVEQQRAPGIGEAYAGPSNLVLHRDIDLKSPPAAVAHHGDRLEIMAQRRRWYRVRTASGQEGWTDDRQLLDKRQMNRLRQLAKETSGLPSQGTATSFDVLNVHTEPNKLAPSFLQMKEGQKFDIIAHRVLERVPLPKRRLIEPKPKLARKKKEKISRYAEPEPPAPPPPPQDWIKLSKERGIPPEDLADEQVVQDDWTLVRLPSGQSGWVLTGRLFLGIPDEVAQYAEGHRIMSYFSLGKIQDGDAQKDIWLWTTTDHLGEDHDFDGYRVFVWSLRHHRYETAYIQRRIRGFFPVLAKSSGEFSVCLDSDNGQRIRKMYSMTGNRVSAVGEKPCEAFPGVEPETPQQLITRAPANSNQNAAESDPSKGWLGRTKEKVLGLFKRKQ